MVGCNKKYDHVCFYLLAFVLIWHISYLYNLLTNSIEKKITIFTNLKVLT